VKAAVKKTKAPMKKPVAKAKPAAKPAVKAAVPKKAAKPAAKPAVKAAKPAATNKKAVSKPAAKVPAKKAPAAKPAAKPIAKPVARKAAAPLPKSKSADTKALKPPVKTKSEPSAVADKPVAKPTAKAAPVKVAPAPVPPKPVRTSRLQQLTVPSMAQAVASTAAKASYTQIPSTPVLTPPPHVAVKKDPKLANNWKTKTADQLSDAEVLAMPDAEYMNDKQMAFFRLKLSLLKTEILNSAGETTEHLREDTVIVPDPADRATIEEEHALELRTRDRERKLLKKIEQSIQRIDAGDYGYCDETGEAIGVGRLLARPTATLSLEAQQRRELKQKMFGD
jgi:DnaK suppressor protein